MNTPNLAGIPDSLNRAVKYLLIFSFFLFFFLSLFQIHIYNYDFWWHLANGKYIVENNTLPENDPFSYTTKDTLSVKKSVILKGYWLAQVIFYKVYSLWDLKGIIILRTLSLSMVLFFIFLNIRKQNAPLLIAVLTVTGLGLYSTNVEGERPILFTYLVFSIVYYLLEDFRINRSKRVFLVPLLVMVLSNMHPGYIVCILLISIYLAGEGIRYFVKKDYEKGIFKGLLIIWLLTIISSMFNPNGPGIYTYVISAHLFVKDKFMLTLEMLPTFHLYKIKTVPVDYLYIAFLTVSLLSLKYYRKIGLIHMLLLVVFTVMSIVNYRYVVFYMYVSAPILVRIIINLGDERVLGKLTSALKGREAFLNLVACIFGLFLVFNAIPSFARFEPGENVFFAVPKGAADFLSKVKIKGNMFNHYGFGGYLIWRLYPDKKVFIDGRALEPDIKKEYDIVAFAVSRPDYSWEDIIKKHNISYIVTQPLWQNGKIIPVVDKLFDSEDWLLIYMDHLSLIFLRNDSKNISIIEKYVIDKRKGLNTIITQASAWSLVGKQLNPNYLITLGQVFFKMGKLDDARKAFMMAYKRDPDNETAKVWLQKLEDNKNRIDRQE